MNTCAKNTESEMETKTSNSEKIILTGWLHTIRSDGSIGRKPFRESYKRNELEMDVALHAGMTEPMRADSKSFIDYCEYYINAKNGYDPNKKFVILKMINIE